jgi:hypothetical protein
VQIGDVEEFNVEEFTGPDDEEIVASVPNLKQLLLDLSSTDHGQSLDMGGRTFSHPNTSSSHNEDWQTTAIWPHQNCSLNELQDDGSIFSLSVKAPAEHPIICMVPGHTNSLSNGTIELPPHAALVLDSTGVNFSNVTIRGMYPSLGLLRNLLCRIEAVAATGCVHFHSSNSSPVFLGVARPPSSAPLRVLKPKPLPGKAWSSIRYLFVHFPEQMLPTYTCRWDSCVPWCRLQRYIRQLQVRELHYRGHIRRVRGS